MKWIFLVVVALVMLFPFYLMVSGSLQQANGLITRASTVLKIWPRNPTGSNFAYMVGLPLFARWTLNSALIAAGYVFPSILVCGMAGYAFAFLKFPGKNVLFIAAMATGFLPGAALWIPQYMTVRAVGARGAVAVIIMRIFWPTAIFLTRAYFKAIPSSLIESARIDGANDWDIFRRVVLPLSGPVIGALMVFKSMEALGDFLWQMLHLQMPEQKTLLVGLYQSMYERLLANRLQGAMAAELGYSLAVAVMVVLPMLLIFVLSSKYFIKGIFAGSVKE